MRTQPARLALPALIAAATVGLVALTASPARACGGMLFPEHSERVGGMSEQELLVAFMPERTVLLASAGYEGATGAPAFILPLGVEPSMVMQSELGVFAALDDLTAPEIHITVAADSDSSRGCGAQTLKDGAGSFNGDDRGEVMVVQRGETTDYQWVLVAGDTGTSLADWLTTNGYTLPADYAAALQPYLDADDFIFAAKLKSTAPTGALAPIEIHLPPIEPTAFKIPFALAAHSLPADKKLTITTYFLAGGGVLPANYNAAPIDPIDVAALTDSTSNYDEAYAAAVAGDGTDDHWVIDSSFSGFSASGIVAAYDSAAAASTLPGGTDRDAVQAFADRVPFTDLRLTRIRSTLGAEQLRDMTLTKVPATDVDRNFFLTLESRGTPMACTVDRERGIPLAALLVPLVLLLRRRRR